MTIGSGIAIAAVWFVSATVIKDNRITGAGVFVMLAAALVATSFIAVGK
ncbi:hypothetical protein [Bradyrhizobium pachyrhizi]|nr:hypothetical protein [Bradyrhizobium pachyrhizi]